MTQYELLPNEHMGKFQKKLILGWLSPIPSTVEFIALEFVFSSSTGFRVLCMVVK